MAKISKSVKKQILNVAFLLLLIGLTLIVLLQSNSELNFENIGNFIASSNKWFLAAAVGCMFVATFCEGLSLYVISRKFGHKCKLWSAMVYSSADIYYSAITPSASGGQPASAYYMVKDGMSVGTASFTLVFNVIAYTAAIVVLGIAALIIRPAMISTFGILPQLLIILGLVVQTLLMLFFIACLVCHKAMLKLGNGLISLLSKMKILKRPEKWRDKLETEIGKYADCGKVIRKHKLLFLQALIINIGQRGARVIISCLVCLAADPSASFWDIFVLQSFLIVGYTSIPLPGGVGIFEYLYINLYAGLFSKEFILSAMMIVRTITYYLSMLLTGLITLTYHIYIMRRVKTAPAAESVAEEGETSEPEAEPSEQTEENGENGKTQPEEDEVL